jgi:hypothetical protein
MSFSTTSDFRFLGRYPDARTAAAALVLMTREERRGFCRSFLLEGTPAAFEDEPMIYEMMREWTARRLTVGAEIQVDPKEITLLGSARLGYSLSPYPKFGRPFSADSDLNFAAVSRALFDALCGDFSRWRENFEKKQVTPSTPREQKHWPENLAVGDSKIYRGFLDLMNIPSRSLYPAARRLKSAMDGLSHELWLTPRAPRVRECSLRVFRDWDACVSQTCLNLNQAVPKNETLPTALFGRGYWEWR